MLHEYKALVNVKMQGKQGRLGPFAMEGVVAAHRKLWILLA